MKIYLNGQTQEKESLQEILEPGFLFGWGVFEVLCAYGFKPAFLDLHTQRLNKSLSILGIEPPKIDWHKEIEGLLSENNLVDAYISAVPIDPKTGAAADTRYYIKKSANGRITVGACDPELSATISVTR